MKPGIDADLVHELRAARSWTQEELAQISGLSLRTVQRIEKDGVGSLESRRALAAAFNVSPADIAKDLSKIADTESTNRYVDHPAPSSVLMTILVVSAAGFLVLLVVALTMLRESQPVWIAPTLAVSSFGALLVLSFAFWAVGSTYYTLSDNGVTVKWGPSVRSYQWNEFSVAYWRRGVFTARFFGPTIHPCVRFSNVIALQRGGGLFSLNLTPNDPEVFLQKIEYFAPRLTLETAA